MVGKWERAKLLVKTEERTLQDIAVYQHLKGHCYSWETEAFFWASEHGGGGAINNQQSAMASLLNESTSYQLINYA